MISNKLKFSIGIFVAVFLLVSPTKSSAYSFVDQSAVLLNEHTIFFTINYDLGFNKYGLKTPILAIRDGRSEDSEVPKLGYKVYEGENEITTGRMEAIVLSSVSVENSEYHIQKGKAGSFSLIGVLVLPPDQISNINKISLKVTSLPFTLIDKNNEFPNGLNSSELKIFKSSLSK